VYAYGTIAWLFLHGSALAADPAPRVFPYEVHTRTLANGLTVDVVPMPTPGVAAAYTWFSVGSRDEVDPGRTGFAHFFEHLNFYGTPSLGREKREDAILALGADENAWTWYDETVYHAVVSTEALPKYLAIEADGFQHLTLTPNDVRREAGAVYGEFRKNQADPDDRLDVLLYATAFTTHPYAHDTMGYEADIKDMPTAYDYSQSFFQRFYRPDNATVLVVGDVKPDEVFALIDKDWSGWERSPQPRKPLPTEPAQTAMRQAHLDWPAPTAARLEMGWKTPGHAYGDPLVAALDLAGEMLVSDIGSLHRRLVEDGGLVDPALFTVKVTLKDPKDLAAAEAIVREEVDKLKQGVDPAYLDTTRKHSRYGFLSGLDNPDTVAYRLGSAIRRGGVDAIDRYYAAYDAQTADTVAAAARTWLVDGGLTVVTLTGPAGEGK
jgi:zinc protease